jgi:hypothetical protein
VVCTETEAGDISFRNWERSGRGGSEGDGQHGDVRMRGARQSRMVGARADVHVWSTF